MSEKGLNPAGGNVSHSLGEGRMRVPPVLTRVGCSFGYEPVGEASSQSVGFRFRLLVCIFFLTIFWFDSFMWMLFLSAVDIVRVGSIRWKQCSVNSTHRTLSVFFFYVITFFLLICTSCAYRRAWRLGTQCTYRVRRCTTLIVYLEVGFGTPVLKARFINKRHLHPISRVTFV